MTTQVKIEHRGGSHPVLVAVNSVPRALLHAPGDACELAVYKNGGEISVTEHEAPPRPNVMGLDVPEDDRLRNAEWNVAEAQKYVEATRAEAEYAVNALAQATAARDALK